MEFQVLSHAGLLVKNKAGKTLICDPWLIGSSYWRSWWNYPPVSKELVNSLKPDYIYLTHIHWDHFHGPSLHKFPANTPIIVPKGGYKRMKDDLNSLGFYNVIELKHGEKKVLDDGFTITSYQYWVFLDSAAMIECDGIRLLNLNDVKLMGAPLRQVVKKHAPIDFVFRSHSSANERLSYTIVDDPGAEVDDLENYIEEFALTVVATGAQYAIPFASNHCHLHKDSMHFNKQIQHPELVKKYFKDHGIESPHVQVMVTGDSWKSDTGFSLTDKKWFENREHYLKEYYQENEPSILKFYAEEDRTVLSKPVVEEYFYQLSRAIPFFLKRYFKGKKFTYVLYAEDKVKYIYNIDIAKGKVETLNAGTILPYDQYPIQVHTTAFIFLRGIEFKIFSHMCIGKRVFYKVKKAEKKYMEALNLVFNCYEYDLFPMKRLFTKRSVQTWLLRWRELGLYVLWVRDMLTKHRIDFHRHLKPPKNNPKGNSLAKTISTRTELVKNTVV